MSGNKNWLSMFLATQSPSSGQGAYYTISQVQASLQLARGESNKQKGVIMSGNRNWPAMFLRKPSSSSGQGAPLQYDESKLPERKKRWTPKPDQINILEKIFNSGVANPPREEIKKITIELQQYGEVGDESIYYWFQNRKRRSPKRKQHDDAGERSTKQKQKKDEVSNSNPTSDSESSSSAMPPAYIRKRKMLNASDELPIW